MNKIVFLLLVSFFGITFLGCTSLKTNAPLVLETKAKKPAPTALEGNPLLKRLAIPNESYTLPNGLSVILSEDKKSPFVAVSVWYQVGSVNEEKGKTGLAHLFEHLMFEGSAHVKAGEHFKILDSSGAFSLNASTNFERTNYYQTVPKSQLELALSLEASRMYFLMLTQEKLDEQRAVVRREREQRFETSPYGLAILQQWKRLFPAPDPRHELVIGSHEDIEAASLGDVQAFYDRFYGPSNATLALVGDFDKDEAKKLILKYFGTLPASKAEKAPRVVRAPLKDQEIIRFPEKLGTLALVRIQYLTPALFQPGDAELDALSLILAGGENGRLTKALTRDKHLASSVSATQQSMGDVSVFSIDAILNPGVDENEAIKAIDEVLSGLITNPPTAAEIDRARNSMLTTFFFGLQNLGGSNGKAETLQSYSRYAGDPNFIQNDLARYLAIDPQSIVETVRAYLPINTNRKILLAIPEVHRVAQKD